MWRISWARPFESSRHISYILLYTNTLTHKRIGSLRARCALVVRLSCFVSRLFICVCLSVWYFVTSSPNVYTNHSYNLLSSLSSCLDFWIFVRKLVKNVWKRGKKYSYKNLFIMKIHLFWIKLWKEKRNCQNQVLILFSSMLTDSFFCRVVVFIELQLQCLKIIQKTLNFTICWKVKWICRNFVNPFSMFFLQSSDSSDDILNNSNNVTLGKSSVFEAVVWQFPNTNQCPIKDCMLSCSSRKVCLGHFHLIHADTTMLCTICNELMSVENPLNLYRHYQDRHPNNPTPKLKPVSSNLSAAIWIVWLHIIWA